MSSSSSLSEQSILTDERRRDVNEQAKHLKNLLLDALAPVVQRAIEAGGATVEITNDEVAITTSIGNALLKVLDGSQNAEVAGLAGGGGGDDVSDQTWMQHRCSMCGEFWRGAHACRPSSPILQSDHRLIAELAALRAQVAVLTVERDTLRNAIERADDVLYRDGLLSEYRDAKAVAARAAGALPEG